MPNLDDLTPADWAAIAVAVFAPPRGRAGILRPRPGYLPRHYRRLPRFMPLALGGIVTSHPFAKRICRSLRDSCPQGLWAIRRRCEAGQADGGSAGRLF